MRSVEVIVELGTYCVGFMLRLFEWFERFCGFAGDVSVVSDMR